MNEKQIDKRVELGTLLDVYGSMLTKKQRQSIEMHFDDDLSYSEIGEVLNISKQAVHDNINKAVKNLESYEKGIGFVSFTKKIDQKLDDIIDSIGVLSDKELIEKLNEIKNIRFSDRETVLYKK